MKKMISKKLTPLFLTPLFALASFTAHASKIDSANTHGLRAKANVESFHNALSIIKGVQTNTLAAFLDQQQVRSSNIHRMPREGSDTQAQGRISNEEFATWNSEINKAIQATGIKPLDSQDANTALAKLLKKLYEVDAQGKIIDSRVLDAVLSNPKYKENLLSSIKDLETINGLTDANLSAVANVIKSDFTFSAENGQVVATQSGTFNQLKAVRTEIYEKFITAANALGKSVEDGIAGKSDADAVAAIKTILTAHLSQGNIEVTNYSAHVGEVAKSYVEALNAYKNADKNSSPAPVKPDFARFLKKEQSPASDMIRRSLFEMETNNHLATKLPPEDIKYIKEHCGIGSFGKAA